MAAFRATKEEFLTMVDQLSRVRVVHGGAATAPTTYLLVYISHLPKHRRNKIVRYCSIRYRQTRRFFECGSGVRCAARCAAAGYAFALAESARQRRAVYLAVVWTATRRLYTSDSTCIFKSCERTGTPQHFSIPVALAPSAVCAAAKLLPTRLTRYIITYYAS